MRWIISNFKGIAAGALELDSGKMSVLTGVNSSGKSSALQSILMMTQSQYHSGEIVLNGPLVRLGEAHDLVRSGAARNNIGLTIESGYAEDEPEKVAKLRVEATFSPSSDNATLRATRLKFTHPQDGDERGLVLDRKGSREADLIAAADAAAFTGTDEILHLKSTSGRETRPLRTYVLMRGLVPTDLVQVLESKQIARIYRTAIRAFFHSIESESYINDRMLGLTNDDFSMFPILEEFSELVRGALEAHRPVTSAELLGEREAVDSLLETLYKLVREWTSLDPALRNELIDLAVESRITRGYVQVNLRPRPYTRENDRWQRSGLLEQTLAIKLKKTLGALKDHGSELRQLASRVRYLGPLRDEPRVVWSQWNELSRGLPVGTRGEFSAVRLTQSAKRHITYTTPDGTSAIGTLHDAVNEWLAYLDIGDSVMTKTVGKLGVRVEVEVAGQSRDLTAVGVGVSQALPLVVAVLSIPDNSIFIVEQPELHLHPAVQARLADFMLTARPSLCCLVETHSEAYVTRIRRRVAENIIKKDRANIIFVEPNQDGATMRNLTISDFGDLSDWPKGFLSGEDQDSRAIMQANIERIRTSNSGE